MKTKAVGYDGKKVEADAYARDCSSRPCFRLGQDKGTFTPGRGYTSYHKKPVWVCMTRHLDRCPDAGTCANCHTVFTFGDKVCYWCGNLIPVEARGKRSCEEDSSSVQGDINE